MGQKEDRKYIWGGGGGVPCNSGKKKGVNSLMIGKYGAPGHQLISFGGRGDTTRRTRRRQRKKNGKRGNLRYNRILEDII
jgi:hypothetical protein